MWIARDKDGTLKAFKERPSRWKCKSEEYDVWDDRNHVYIILQDNSFKDVLWNGEPVEILKDSDRIIELIGACSRGISEDIDGNFYTIYDVVKIEKLIKML